MVLENPVSYAESSKKGLSGRCSDRNQERSNLKSD
jgi:hypothetical protein